MFKCNFGKLKLPQKLQGSILRFEKEENGGSSNEGFEHGEELETFLKGDGLCLERGNVDQSIEIYENSANARLEREVSERSNMDYAAYLFSRKRIVEDEEKKSDLEHELSQKEINLEKLQRIASTGLPDGGGLRATIWKLLLGYLPASRDIWDKELREKRIMYANLKQELLMNPSQTLQSKCKDTEVPKIHAVDSIGEPVERYRVLDEDHPLSLGKASAWHQYFEFAEISDQIDRDLQRTHPDMKFFSGDSGFSRKTQEDMKNILLLFAKMNPEISYVQGMNEVLAPLYYVFSTDTDENHAKSAEADSFSCFVKLMSDLMDHFCQQLDNSPGGIYSTLSRFSELLKANDTELWLYLELTTKVSPQLYAFRWITLMLTREFNLQTVLRIWDTLLSSPWGIQEMLLRVCCAMVLCVRRRLLTGNFMDNMKLLQHYPEMEIEIEHLLKVGQSISPEISSYRM